MKTQAADPTLAEGTLLEVGDGRIVLGVPETSYKLHLMVDEAVSAAVGSRVFGRIYARAKRVDVVRSGGRYIEPVIGRPRRVQGRTVAADAKGRLIVSCGVPFICELTANQSVNDFGAGQLVSFDVERGASFRFT